ncbi:hypothetical protein [Methylobacterium sp. ID0610]|uniref:hypothetical protein n=1 Tax=Methylobacterium carpenticola TaxID=3344827 RepID=UPI0036994BDE
MSREYGHGQRAARPRMVVAGLDLGTAMVPADVYIEIKRLLELDDDKILAAFAAGADALAKGDAAGPLVEDIDDLDATSAALEVSRSRLKAWRKHARQMTWPELRVLLLGLRSIVLADRASIRAGHARD